MQDVVVASVQLVQNPHAAEPCRAQFERSRPRTPSQTYRPASNSARVRGRLGAPLPATRASAACDRGRRSRAPGRLPDVAGTRTSGRAASRSPDPARSWSAAAPCTRRPTLASSARIVVPGNPQHQPADRIRRPPAVVEHVAPGLVPRHRDVLPERAEQILQQRDGKPARANRVRRARRRPASVRSLRDGSPLAAARRRAFHPSRPASRSATARSPSSAMSSASRAKA